MPCPGSLSEGLTAETRILDSGLDPGPVCSSSQVPRPRGAAITGPLTSLQMEWPLLLPGGPCLGWQRLPRKCQQPLLQGWVWFSSAPRQPSLQAIACQRRCDFLGNLPPCVPFSLLRAETQALSQGKKCPEHRTVEMFLGAQLQGTCFRREGNEEEKAANNPQAVVRTSPYLP